MDKPDYEPDVSECRDIVGNPIKVGDKVAWGAGGERSFGIGLGVVTGVAFERWNPTGYRAITNEDGTKRREVAGWEPSFMVRLKSSIPGRVGKPRRSDRVVHYVEEGGVTCQLKYLTHLEREVGVEGAA